MVSGNRYGEKTPSIGVRIGGTLLTRRIVSPLRERNWAVTDLLDEEALKSRDLRDFDIVLLHSDVVLQMPPAHESSEEVPNVVVLLDGEDDPSFEKVARWGVNAIVDRDDSSHNIVHAIEQAMAGAVWISPTFAERWIRNMLPEHVGVQRIPEPRMGESLTAREREVFVLLCQGMSNSQVAARLVLSVGAVKFHVSNLLRKFGCQRRSQLIARFQGRGSMAREPQVLAGV